VIDEALELENVADQNSYEKLFYCDILMGDYLKASLISKKHLSTIDPWYDFFASAHLHKSRGEHNDAIKNFQLASNKGGISGYELGQLYLELGQYGNALQLIQKMQRTNISYFHFPLRPVQYARSFYLLGKICEKKGDSKFAIENYEKFLDLWKDADPDIPELIDAKERLSMLEGML
jgi:tetratricopeptide (TPR) repeat protein